MSLNSKRQNCLVVMFILAMAIPSFSQSGRDKKERDREESRIGYGVNIGNIRFYNQTFEFGLAPNIAYKITDPFALGFMLKADYFFTKYYDFNGNAFKFSSFDFGPTVFARIKPLWNWEGATPFLQGIFLQGEYERAFLTRADPDQPLVIGDPVPRIHLQQDYVYLGIGFASGYPFSTFVSLHYNVLDEYTSLRFPFSYRIGFTYNY